MRTLNATEARANFFKLIDEANFTREPIHITSKRNNVVLISEADWRSINETLYLLSIPGMRESIIEGMNTPIEDCDTELDW